MRAPSADDALVGYSWAARLIEMELQGNETDSLYPFDSPCLEWSNDSFLQLIIDVTISFQGEGTLDILDEEFRYDHDASINSCKGDMEGQLATGCWPLGRLLLHPEEHEKYMQKRPCCLLSARSSCCWFVSLLKVSFVALTRMCRRYQDANITTISSQCRGATCSGRNGAATGRNFQPHQRD